MTSISHIPREIASLTLSQLSETVTDSGTCVGTADDRWHPDVEPTGERGRAEYESHARKVCADCPVRSQCLLLALKTESQYGVQSHGIWGGTAPWERERMLRRIRRRTRRVAHVDELPVAVEGVSA
ncbi:WhiB family transcriptional regulator [Actinomadura sp. WAC 06369]|uniref:WhiB family transcriptional regulator n=1 Tax=Actinomadura sp. WAC 06369 TaxID=2203193 RepID=UPI0013150536|nr:WhiB family transcriptional regulator [Actinomadura sp. WAC 06369]